MKTAGQLALLIAVITGGLLWPNHTRTNPREIRFIFYDPDANQQALGELAAWFKPFLQTLDPAFQFQPVQDPGTLAAMLVRPGGGFAIIASSFVKAHSSKSIEPLLVPMSKDIYYQKILLETKAGESGNLNGKTIAATLTGYQAQGDGDASNPVLSLLRNVPSLKADSAMVIPVTKDIDALFALAFGQVEAALVTEGSLRVLKKLQPSALDTMREIYRTPKILRAPLVAFGPQTNGSLKKVMIAAFLDFSKNETGRAIMGLLSCENWKPFSRKMLKGKGG